MSQLCCTLGNGVGPAVILGGVALRQCWEAQAANFAYTSVSPVEPTALERDKCHMSSSLEHYYYLPDSQAGRGHFIWLLI
jgi:hypothetical protein